MARELQVGTVVRGVLYRGVEDAEGIAAVARLTDEGVEVDLPAAGRGYFDDASDGWGRREPQAWLNGDLAALFLPDIWCLRQRSTSGVTAETWFSPRAVEAGSIRGLRRVDYRDIHGMDSEIDGLSAWSGVSGIEQHVAQVGSEGPHYTLNAYLIEPVSLGGPLNLCLSSGFSYDPMNRGTFRGVRDILTVRTLDTEPAPWAEHVAVHRLVQDLVSLAFGEAQGMRLTQVVRRDDQPDFVSPNQSLLWRGAFDPLHGSAADEGRVSKNRTPLFALGDVDRQVLADFLSSPDRWGRPLAIASAVLFTADAPPHMRLTQVGVALESLGYAIWQEAGGGGKTPAMPTLLAKVSDAAGISHRAIYGEHSPDEWRRHFNANFKGTKHADNPLPEPHEASVLASQGLALICVWLARHLGAPTDVVSANLEHLDLPH